MPETREEAPARRVSRGAGRHDRFPRRERRGRRARLRPGATPDGDLPRARRLARARRDSTWDSRPWRPVPRSRRPRRLRGRRGLRGARVHDRTRRRSEGLPRRAAGGVDPVHGDERSGAPALRAAEDGGRSRPQARRSRAAGGALPPGLLQLPPRAVRRGRRRRERREPVRHVHPRLPAGPRTRCPPTTRASGAVARLRRRRPRRREALAEPRGEVRRFDGTDLARVGGGETPA